MSQEVLFSEAQYPWSQHIRGYKEMLMISLFWIPPEKVFSPGKPVTYLRSITGTFSKKIFPPQFSQVFHNLYVIATVKRHNEGKWEICCIFKNNPLTKIQTSFSSSHKFAPFRAAGKHKWGILIYSIYGIVTHFWIITVEELRKWV